jgi:hypothetical protein
MKKAVICLIALVTIPLATANAADGLGSVKGQFIFDGEAPKLPPLVTKGQAVKDPEVCSVEEVPNQSLLVDPKTKAVQNVFIYLYKAPKDMPEEFATPPKKEHVFDQKGCMFVNHVMLIQAGQSVKVISDDACNHNVHSYPIRNDAFNFSTGIKNRKGIVVADELVRSEKYPFKVTCDFHSWMSSYWLVLDHPYMAVSDAQGNFEIKNLPPGEHSFYIWQESLYAIDKDFKITVKAGETTDVGQVKIKK